jgi:hypothetical protein
MDQRIKPLGRFRRDRLLFKVGGTLAVIMLRE